MREGGEDREVKGQEGDTEGQHGGRAHPRGECDSTEEPGTELPQNERQGGRGG